MAAALFDRAAVLDNLDGDRELLREIASIYVNSYIEDLNRIAAAIAAGDAAKVFALTHTIKGSIGNFGAGEAVEVARTIERHAREGQLGDIEASFQRLQALLDQLAAELRPELG